jgi:hypothetical protein
MALARRPIPFPFRLLRFLALALILLRCQGTPLMAFDSRDKEPYKRMVDKSDELKPGETMEDDEIMLNTDGKTIWALGFERLVQTVSEKVGAKNTDVAIMAGRIAIYGWDAKEKRWNYAGWRAPYTALPASQESSQMDARFWLKLDTNGTIGQWCASTSLAEAKAGKNGTCWRSWYSHKHPAGGTLVLDEKGNLVLVNPDGGREWTAFEGDGGPSATWKKIKTDPLDLPEPLKDFDPTAPKAKQKGK